MRLLKILPGGGFHLTDSFEENAIPPYGILSHRCEQDENQEVTFEDMNTGDGRGKLGFKKIEFCGQQAIKDGLAYFWVDSCCINKQNKVELSQAIRSMFRWYRNAYRCYVFLSDVSAPGAIAEDEKTSSAWKQDFRNSKWFTRGWTLQELLAPSSVEFFSCERNYLGSKITLQQDIHKTTAIPLSAIQGTYFLRFTVRERLNWIEHRETSRPEDKAYSLLGIFGVSLHPIYGEGAKSAFERLQMEIDKLERCLRALHCTDPRKDKRRIESEKGGLFNPSSRWILEHPDFRHWRDEQRTQLLWVKGDPGKGKTMLLCGIVDELENQNHSNYSLSYFFCQATDVRINNATAVLRGLLYLLILQQPSLHLHVQQQLDHAGPKLFEDVNAWVTVSELFEAILEDMASEKVFLVIDALDECLVDLPRLLDFIVRISSCSPSIKWLVSARNWPSIEERLERAEMKTRLSIELNADSVTVAVSLYTRFKADQLALEKELSEETRDAIFEYLSLNAHNTFLWVALVYQRLRQVQPWNVIASLRKLPPGLYALYERMLSHIAGSEDVELCTHILGLAVIVYRPITLDELICLAELPEDIRQNREWLKGIIALCGSFLAVKDDTIHLVHQSARDYLLERAFATLYPNGVAEAHHQICLRSLRLLSTTLRRDIYRLGAPDYSNQDVKMPNPDPLAGSRYSVSYWPRHVCDSYLHASAGHDDNAQGRSILHVFLREKFLFWLEALSLCESLSQGIVAMTRLKVLFEAKSSNPKLLLLTEDCLRFILYFQRAIRSYPLQVYLSALVFSPTHSLLRQNFGAHEPKWIRCKTALGQNWGPCLATLEGHGEAVDKVIFSPDGKIMASASASKYDTIRLWDVEFGTALATLKGQSDWISSVIFSPDSQLIVSASQDSTIVIWNTQSGMALATLEGHQMAVDSVVFSPDGELLASASKDATIKLWSVESRRVLATLHPPRCFDEKFSVKSATCKVIFSPDGRHMATVLTGLDIVVWDVRSGTILATLKGHTEFVNSIVFSFSGKLIASGSDDRTVRIWDAKSGVALRKFECYMGVVYTITCLPNSKQVVSESRSGMIRMWDIESGEASAVLRDLDDFPSHVAVSPDGTLIASVGIRSPVITLWDASLGVKLAELDGHSKGVATIAFSPDGTRLATGSWDRTVNLWDTRSSAALVAPKSHSGAIVCGAFSSDGRRVASGSMDKTIGLWDCRSGTIVGILKGHNQSITAVCFSSKGTLLVSGSKDGTVRLWDCKAGQALKVLEGHHGDVCSVSFSFNDERVVSASFDATVKVWDTELGTVLMTCHMPYYFATSSVALSPDGNRVAAGSSFDRWTVSSVWCVTTGRLQATHSSKATVVEKVNSITFSSDSRYIMLASALDGLWEHSDAHNVMLWDTESEDRQPTQTYQFNEPVKYVHFSENSDQLKTNRGNLLLPREGDNSQHLKRVGLFVSNEWIMFGEQKLIWLPIECRPGYVLVDRQTIFIGHESGRVSFFWVDTENIPEFRPEV